MRAAARSGRKTEATRPLAENLLDQKRKLLRAMVVVEDAGLGRRSLLVASNPDGSTNQARLAEVLAGANIIIGEVADALEELSKAPDASARQAAP